MLSAGLGQTLSATFTPADTANYATATASVTIDVTASSGPTFTDSTMAAGVRVKAVHLTELRQAIATLRARYGLSVFGWTDAPIVAGVTPVRAVHLTELRTALQGVYVAAGRAVPTYTQAPVTARVTVVRAVDIAELRAAVVAIW